ncbi:amidohydrolase family protein [Shewanella zhangzhouensis]|uniref:amidohydrolase family protein n=1 Tax=Shewanella zhangzhouensis TaxID=2864213 RepID=UPI001C65D31F|nr:amidohydrolase family protein [Shewanella zhangzhouensis]QYK05850.1 amidohydrolase family protein [Shewanella zhangzhouensis]
MRIFRLVKLFAISLILLIALALLSIPASIICKPDDLLAVNNGADMVLKNGNLVDVETGVVVSGQYIYLSNGRIVSIGSELPENADSVSIVDVNNAYILPGLFDMHVHVHDRKYLAMYLAYGVTSVRNMRGNVAHLRWKQELNAGQWLGSNLFTSSPVLDGPLHAHALQKVVTSAEAARQLVKQYKSEGYDLIKAYGYLEPDIYTAIVDEAFRLNFPVAKHGPQAILGLDLISNAGLQSLEHVEDIFQGPLNYSLDEAKMVGWVRELRYLKPRITPTLATFHHLTELSIRKQDYVETIPLNTLNPLYRLLHQQLEVKRWLQASPELANWNKQEEAFLLKIVNELNKQGIELLLGSDAGTLFLTPGESTHLEIALLLKAGVPPLKVLQAGTINAARALGVEHEFGSITAGKVADLIVVKANPLTDMQTLMMPIAVIKKGQWIGESEIAMLKQSAQQPANLYLSFGQLLEDLGSRALD